MAMARLRAAAEGAAAKIAAGFTSLRGSPRDIYLVFLCKVFESYNYFSLSRILTLYLTEEFEINDYHAGIAFGLWGTLLVAYGLFLGGAIDALGVRSSLILCFVLNVASRLVMASTTTPWLLLAMLLGPNAAAGALGVPVMTIAVKRFTTPLNRGFAFSLFYTLMNLAALSQGVLMDVFRIRLKHGFRIVSLGSRHMLNDGTRLFLLSGCLTSLAGLIISFGLADATPHAARKETADRLPGGRPPSGELELPSSPEAPLIGSSAHSGSEYSAASAQGEVAEAAPPRAERAAGGAGAWASARAVLATKGFYKFLAMSLITVNLKGIFRHVDATLPKYQLRAFGCAAPVGLIYAINPAMIVALVPVVGALTTTYAHFDVIHAGAYVSALSPLFVVAFGSLWSTAAFVAALSLGEAVWSPRWYDYAMSVAPEGREGVFTALTSAPLFAAMLPTGMMSGALLQRYCPDTGQCVGGGGGGASGAPAPAPAAPPSPCDGRALWAVVWLVTMSSPLLISLTQRWLRPAPTDFSRPPAPALCALEEPATDVNEADPAAVLEHVWGPARGRSSSP